MKKRVLTLLCLLLICSVTVLPAFAAVPRLVDDAGYLTEYDKAELLKKLNEISTRQGVDVVIVTVPSLNGRDITAFADDYYDTHGYALDGILLLVAAGERQWAISTLGFGITAFTDAGQAYISDKFVEKLSDGRFAEGFEVFADLCDEFLTQAKNGSPYDTNHLPKAPFQPVFMLFVCLAGGFVAALIVTAIMAAQLKSVRRKQEAAQYVRSGSMDVTGFRDLYLYRQVNRVRKEPPKSSGGSSTHTSSSGRTHGGSRGSF